MEHIFSFIHPLIVIMGQLFQIVSTLIRLIG